MSLTGTFTICVLWTLAAATFVWGVVAWPKAAGAGWLAHLRRIGSQLAVVATAILTVAATLNAQNDWYSSWNDLGTALGGGDYAAANPQLLHSGGDEPAAPMPSVAESKIGALNPDPGPDGQYVTLTLPGPVSKVSGKVVIWLPQSYTQAGSSQRHYPVIEAFHGVPGSPFEYSRDINLGKLVAGVAAAGQIREAILVMPDFISHGLDTECVNGGVAGPEMETWLTQDIPTWVQQNVRVKPGRDSWATMGLSTGGFCSVMAAMLHPQTYRAAIELGGYLSPIFAPSYQPFARGSIAWGRYDLVKLAATAPPPVALWIETSKTDSLSYRGNSRLIATAQSPMTVTADILLDAGHRMSVWVGAMPVALRWLGSTIAGFKP